MVKNRNQYTVNEYLHFMPICEPNIFSILVHIYDLISARHHLYITTLEKVTMLWHRIRGSVKNQGPVFFVYFWGHIETSYQGENVQEVCTWAPLVIGLISDILGNSAVGLTSHRRIWENDKFSIISQKISNFKIFS